MTVDLVAMVGRPVPPNATARDVILSALLGGVPRTIRDGDSRLLAALPSLIEDGIVLADGEMLSLAPGAADAALAARDRMREAREARAEWGALLQSALRERRSADQVRARSEAQLSDSCLFPVIPPMISRPAT